MIIHLLSHPISARKFAAPLVSALNESGEKSELWVEPRRNLGGFISSLRCPYRTVWFDLSLNPVLSAFRFVLLVCHLSRVKPKAVYAHQTKGAFLPLLAAALLGIRVRIYQNHGLPYLGYSGFLRGLLYAIEWCNCLLATHVLAISRPHSEVMVAARLVPSEKCSVILNGSACGIDLAEYGSERFQPSGRHSARKRLGLPENSFVALYVGRPVKRKGFLLTLKAWEVLSGSGAVLLMAGCDARDVASVMGQPPPGVIPLGNILELSDCYAAADVVVLPSFHEGVPYSLLEGGAAYRALVSTDIPGMSTLVRNDINGQLIDVGDYRALGRVLRKLQSAPELSRKYGEKSRAIVEELFARDRYVSEFSKYMKSALYAREK